jgi:NTP pyrophosphatase (non-canonical NTP hydrolase)
MDFEEYHTAVARTWGGRKAGDSEYHRLISALGVAGEAGEVCDYIKKVVHHGEPFDPVHLAEEVGDVLWYLANLCTAFRISMNFSATHNLKKLEIRYPNGFSVEDSLNRKDQL